jgi:methylamine dehydrogenase heavy chain
MAVNGGSGPIGRASRRGLRAATGAFALAAALAGGGAGAVLPSDIGTKPEVFTLPETPGPHWVWVNDFKFGAMSDGQARLVDAGTGKYLGTLSTGYGFVRVVPSRDHKLIYSPETYFSRGTRGERTDIVQIYDARTLAPVAEIPTPPKRSSNLPMMADVYLTDDDRFLVMYQFNPGQSVGVVDTASRKYVTDIETPGCALVYPTGPRTFFSVCGDGSALSIELNDQGAVAHQARTAPLFDFAKDPVTEKAVRLGDTWYFASFDGQVIPVKATGTQIVAQPAWWLTTKEERAAGWRSGGLQHLAIHAGTNRLYVLMHQGGRDTHKDPGKEVWVYDLATKKRVQKIALRTLSTSIVLSSDASPLLYSLFADGPDLDVYDGRTGRHVRTIGQMGMSPTLLVTP